VQFLQIIRIVGALLILCSLTMLPPAAVALHYDDGGHWAFFESFGMVFLVGALLYWPVRNLHQELRVRDGFIVVVVCWLVLGLGGAVPLLLVSSPDLSVTDAVFESMSGLTTTGATVLTGIDVLPKGILYYRQQMQWVGGMGIIVLAVAVLPMLRIGGMQLYRAETPGPMKDSKLTPRIAETAKALWYIYLGLTVVCAAAYWLAGMTPFDAVGHAFSTVAIGGFSTHDLSLAYFESVTIEMIAVFFMLVSGINFALHFLAWRRSSMGPYLRDSELKAYLVMIGVVAVICSVGLYLSDLMPLSALESIRYGVFQAVSFGTTTGYASDTNFYLWPGALPLLLLVISCVGGCAGSTGGGVKVIRVLLLYKQGLREITRLIHPSAMALVKFGGKSTSEKVIQSVWGFFSLYLACLITLSLVLAGMGIDLETAVSAVVSCLNNLGPALGDAGPNYAELPNGSKWVLALAMILGRLELFTLLVLFTAVFWRS